MRRGTSPTAMAVLLAVLVLVSASSVAAAPAAAPEVPAHGPDPAACHHQAHVQGRAAAHQGQSVVDALNDPDLACGGGFLHGLVEAVVGTGDPGSTSERASTACRVPSAAALDPLLLVHCAHGVGHGVMAASGYDVGRALALCDILPTSREQDACLAGLFMQYLMAEHDGVVPTPALDPDHALAPCAELAPRHAPACLRRQTTYALAVAQGDVGVVSGWCGDLRPELRRPCFQGLGRDVGQGALAAGRPELTVDGCDALPVGARDDCLVGGVRATVRWYERPDEAERVCARLTAARRAWCSAEVTAALGHPER